MPAAAFSKPLQSHFNDNIIVHAESIMNFFLIIGIIIVFAILTVVGLYLLVYYQHPDDHNEAYVPKAVVIFGFVLAGATVLLLPLDVANNEGYAGT
jgi:LMBR1 domain-containing protein 1